MQTADAENSGIQKTLTTNNKNANGDSENLFIAAPNMYKKDLKQL